MMVRMAEMGEPSRGIISIVYLSFCENASHELLFGQYTWINVFKLNNLKSKQYLLAWQHHHKNDILALIFAKGLK